MRTTQKALLIGVALAAGAAVMGAPADLARGLAWLQVQVQPAGTLANESGVAASIQARCEVATTLLKLAAGNTPIAALVSSLAQPATDATTESMACWLQLREQLTQTLLVGDLDARRLGQGGFAAHEAFGMPSSLDTGRAMAIRMQTMSASDKAKLLAWLQANQSPAGSFAIAGRADLLATAAVLRGLRDEVPRNAVAAVVATSAAGWLLAQRAANGTWLGDVATTASVFEAVHPYTGSQADIASTVEVFLLAAQGSDGSWAGDPYVTAVALRALALTAAAPVDPTVAGTSASVRGVAIEAATGRPLAGVSVKVLQSAESVKSTVTDAQGRYLLLGIAPGAVTLSASIADYQTITMPANLLAARTAVFSPAMYPIGAPVASGGQITGRLVAFGSTTGLAGATVQVTTAAGAASSTATDHDGRFEVRTQSGSVLLSYSLGGYTAASSHVVLSDGSTVHLGNIPLRPIRQDSTLRGTVTDSNGRPIQGATVDSGANAKTVTDSAGSYALSNLPARTLEIRATAPGHATRSVTLSFEQPMDAVQDFMLPSDSAGYLGLSDFQLSASSAGLRRDITATVVVSNPSSHTTGWALRLDVISPEGNAVATTGAHDGSGHALSPVTLAPGQQAVASFRWNTGSFPPGAYQLTARLYSPDSMTHANPAGIVLGSLSRTLAIERSYHFSGSVAANPPVQQAGAGTPINFSALIQNDGNAVLPAQDYTIAVVNSATGQTTFTHTLNSAELPVSQLRSLSFPAWTPAGGGDFRVELTAPSTPGSRVAAKLYVGNASSANFSVDRPTVPAGTHAVRATVAVDVPDAAAMLVADPLTPLIKQAVVKAVNYADAAAMNKYNSQQCFACHVQAQSVAGGERSRRYAAPVDALRRAILMSGVSQNLNNPTDGAIFHRGPTDDAAVILNAGSPGTHRITNTSLGLWAASQWHEPAAVNYTKVRLARYLMQQQRSDGSWLNDHPDGPWWRTKAPLAALNLGSLSELKSQAQAAVQIGAKRLAPVSVPGLPAGPMRLAADASGTLYVTILNGAVWSVSPAGAATMLVNSLPAYAAMPLGDGRLAIGASNGTYIRQLDGTLTKLNSLPVNDIQLFPNGDLLVKTFWWDSSGRLYRVTRAGVTTTFAVHNWISGTVNAIFMPDSSVVALNQTNRNVLRFTSAGHLRDLPVPLIPANATPHASIAYNGGFLMTTDRGMYFYNKDWVGERWTHESVFGVVKMPDGRLLVNYNNGIYEVQEKPVDVAALVAQIDASVGTSATWLKNGIGIDGNDNVDLAFRLMGLASAKKHFRGTSRATEFDALIQSLGATLRGRQRGDGGWAWKAADSASGGVQGSDSMVTAMVGVALDALSPSPNAPEVRNAIAFLLASQRADGTWASENGLAKTALIPSTWVEIWLPTMLDRLATMDTDLRLTFAPNVVMSNPDVTPTSTLEAPDGSITHLWKLSGVTDAGRQVSFDVTLKDMQVDEVRPVALDASLVFNNSFVQGSVTAAIGIPKVAVTTNLTASVTASKASYTEAEQALFTAQVVNAGVAARTAQVRFNVLDAAGQLVQALPLSAAFDIAAGASATATVGWPVAGALAGNYQVRAELLSPAGLLYGTATATFAVTASQQQADATRILTDRSSYSAAQTVQVSARAANLTANVVQENLRAVTVVRDSAGSDVFHRSEAIPQLAPGGQRQYGYAIAASGLAVGSYSAILQLFDAQGALLSQSTSGFSVLGTAQSGVGLGGRLQAMPSAALIGQAIALSLEATNNGNTALADVPVTVRLIEPESAFVVASFSANVASWPQEVTRSLAWNWSAAGLDGQTLVAAASARVGGRDIALGQARIRLIGVPQLKAEPAQLDFAPRYTGETSALQSVLVSSSGSATATMAALTLDGAHPAQFVLAQDGCPQGASLPIGATCSFSVSYRPSDAGEHGAQVRITHSNGADAAVKLTGQARPVVLAGSLRPSPAEIHIGETTSLAWSVSNPADATVTLPLNLSLRDGTGHAVESWEIPVALGPSATVAGSQGYTAKGGARTLTAVLSQPSGNDSVVIGTASLVITEIPVKVDPAIQSRREARILVLVSCPAGEGRAGAPAPDDAACVAQRSQAIGGYLDSLGIANKVVITGEEFQRELCCGTYNTYWISGGAAKLSAELAGQLREAVWGGEGLLVDGVHDARNQLLHPVNGILHRGKLPTANQAIGIAEGAIYPAGILSTLGQPFKSELLPQAQAQAWFGQAPGRQAPAAAIVSHRYGSGQSLLFAFDLAGMLSADPQATGSQLRELMGISASHAASGTQTLTIGDVTALALGLRNEAARGAGVQVRATLPAGVSYHSASIAPTAVQQQAASAGTVTWTIGLDPRQSRELVWRVVGRQAGVFEMPLAFYSVPQGAGETARLLETRSLTLTVPNPADLVRDAVLQVQALEPAAPSDKSRKNKAVDAANRAASLHGQGRHEEAIGQWLAAAEALASVATADTAAARSAVALALEASTDAMCAAAQ